ncbi:MAG TPA: hypothetical protein VFX49_14530, partial [Chloroflexota bacterium]|nr:hypothetical protein [Chloroflexota bacterium]
QRPVTTSGLNRAPVWSPDGQWLAFLSARAGAFDIWLVGAPPDAAPPVPSGSGGASSGPPTPAASVARQVTQNGGLDAASGLSWAR